MWWQKYRIIIGLVLILTLLAWGIWKIITGCLLPDQGRSVLWAQAIPETSLRGQTLAVITGGDIICPRLSPDGQLLVYAQIVIGQGEDGNIREYTRVILYTIATQEKKDLIDTKNSKQYANDCAYVIDIQWINNQQLFVNTSNGEAGTTVLRIDLFNDKVEKLAQDNIDATDYQLPPDKQKIADEVSALFKDFEPDVLQSALVNSSFFIPGRGLVLQKRYKGYDHHIWLLDFPRRKMYKLLELPNEKSRLEGGLWLKKSVLFIINDNSRVKFYRLKNNRVTLIATIPVPHRNVSPELKLRQTNSLIFLLKIYDRYEKGDNPLFIFNGTGLLQIKDYPELNDFNTSLDGSRMVFCYWENGERRLALRDLKK